MSGNEYHHYLIMNYYLVVGNDQMLLVIDYWTGTVGL